MSDQLDYHWIYISRVLFEINLDSYFANGLVLSGSKRLGSEFCFIG